jgi:UDP-N-acetyl-2-amino-2-deoxyglucuronate dehydrogenase
LEQEYGKRTFVVLQFRLHPNIVALRDRIGSTVGHDVQVYFCTPRGKWYDQSWKGNPKLSGGLPTNIGIHIFDGLLWLFGGVVSSQVFQNDHRRARGNLTLEQANVHWELSVEPPRQRRLIVDGVDVDFDEGFTDLHGEVYRRILDGNGFTLDDARASVQLVHDIRNAL